MAERENPDWVQAYLDYTENTESADVFHKWTAYSMISAVLRKKVRLELGRINVYPNMYIVLVAEPGVARKSQAISYGTKFLDKLPDVFTTADSITREALLDDLEKCAVDEPLPGGETMRHTSISIIAKEFEIFLGQKVENTKMLVLLTDLFDAQEVPWKYRTKSSGTNIIPSVYVNLLGATTPESLASCLPPSAIGGGLTSRILFVWASKKGKKIPIPTISESVKTLGESIQRDLFKISKIAGIYQFSKEAEEFWCSWYMSYDEASSSRVCLDKSFDGWYSRKPMYILKMTQVLAASQSDDLLIQPKHIERAISEIESIEHYMSRTFRAVGRSEITADVDVVSEIIKDRGVISEKKLMQLVWRDIDAGKFDNVINTAIKTGRVQRLYQFQGTKGIFYTWNNDA
jgi:hypothetical protein